MERTSTSPHDLADMLWASGSYAINDGSQGDMYADEDVITTIALPYKVILFNDNIHTFDEVIGQVCKAIDCTAEHAESIAWEVHTKGKSIVYTGDMSECLRVSSILEEIALHTQVVA
jgi:ATP-dependent Clp protease adaptor protein ClpS